MVSAWVHHHITYITPDKFLADIKRTQRGALINLMDHQEIFSQVAKCLVAKSNANLIWFNYTNTVVLNWQKVTFSQSTEHPRTNIATLNRQINKLLSWQLCMKLLPLKSHKRERTDVCFDCLNRAHDSWVSLYLQLITPRYQHRKSNLVRNRTSHE